MRSDGWADRWRRRPRRNRAQLVVGPLLAAALIALCVWVAGRSRDDPAAQWGVAVLIGAALGAAAILGQGRQRQTGPIWVADNARWIRQWRRQPKAQLVAVGVWTVLILAAVGWDLVSFAAQAHAYPTLSYFIGRVTRYPVGRGLLFGLWLALGAYLAAGRRAGARRP
jgi:hypothetical protein